MICSAELLQYILMKVNVTAFYNKHDNVDKMTLHYVIYLNLVAYQIITLSSVGIVHTKPLFTCTCLSHHQRSLVSDLTLFVPDFLLHSTAFCILLPYRAYPVPSCLFLLARLTVSEANLCQSRNFRHTCRCQSRVYTIYILI